MREKAELRRGEGQRAFHYLKILSDPGATISVGTNVGKWLHQEGYVTIAKWGRYGITQAGIDLLHGKTKDKPQRELNLGGPGGSNPNSNANLEPRKVANAE